MKHLIIALLFSCTIVTASQKPVKLDNFQIIQNDGNRFVATAQEKSTQKKFSFEQNKQDTNKTPYCFHMKPTINLQTPGFSTQGVVFKDVTEKHPELLQAFEHEIDEFQKNQAKSSLRNTETKNLKNSNRKRLPFIRRASSILRRK